MLLQPLPTGLTVRRPRSGLIRIPFVRHCTITGPLSRQQGLICNLGAAGVYVRLHGELEPGTAVQLSFEIFPGDSPVVAEATVAWLNAEPRRVRDLPPGCGLRFSALKPQDESRIAALVTGYASVPS